MKRGAKRKARLKAENAIGIDWTRFCKHLATLTSSEAEKGCKMAGSVYLGM